MNKRKLPSSNSFLENEKSDPKRAEFQTSNQEDQEVFNTAPNHIIDENNNQMRYKIKELNDSLEDPQIEARVKSVSNIITYGKTGRLVEVVLSDETGDIRAIIYRELIKKIVLKENELTRISGFKVKKAYKNQKFGSHEFEICMTASTLVDRINQQIIEPSPNKLGIMFTRLSNVMSKKPNDKVSIFGIMSDNSERVVINNRVVVNIHLFDESITLVRCTLWENLAKQLINIKDPNPIIVLENAKICELDEKFVSSDARTRLYVNPDLEETEDLLLWFYINFKQ